MCLKKKINHHQNHKVCCVNLLCNNILYFALFAIDFFCRFGYNSLRQFAGVMELADVLDSKSSGSDTVPVRPRSPAPKVHRNFDRITVDFFYARKPLEIKTFAVFEHKRTPPQSDSAAGFCALHGFCGFFVVVIVKQLG